MRKIIISGSTPSKKNSTVSIVRNGRVLHFPGNVYKKWHSPALREAQAQRLPSDPLFACASVEITIFAPTARAGDLTNKAESVMDLLVDAKILRDDDWHVVPELILKFGGVDRTNPRAEVLLG